MATSTYVFAASVGAQPATVAGFPAGRQTAVRAGREFVQLYADDPVWIPPLLTEQRHQFSPKSAFFEHAQVRLFVAYRDGRPVVASR